MGNIPNIKVQGIRGSIPTGHVLGRLSGGTGAVELIPIPNLNAVSAGSGGGGGGGGGNIQTLLDSITTTQGSLIYRNASNWTFLAPPGVNGEFLVFNLASVAPAWSATPAVTLTNGHIFVGNASGVATDVALSGDASISNTGVLSLSSGLVLGGNPTTTTQTAGNNTTRIATTAFVTTAVAAVSDATLLTSNITTNNVSTTKHGFAPILPNDATKFLNGIGTYTTPPGSSLSPGTPPVIVQSAIAVAASASITLGAAPTNGNLLVAIFFDPTTQAAGAGWAIRANNSTGTDFGVVLTKTAGAGESATQTPMGGVPTTGLIAMWELSGQAVNNFIFGAVSAGAGALQSSAPFGPTITNCLTLMALALVSTSNNILTVANITQDQIINTGVSRQGVMGHSDASRPLGMPFVTFSGAGTPNSKCGVIVITA